MDTKCQILQHFLATIAYRTQKALREAPPGFEHYRVAEGVRTPHELVWHMVEVLGYAERELGGGIRYSRMAADFAQEVERFHEILNGLKAVLESSAAFGEELPERLLQGPLSDAMSHVGQLAMLRRLFGSPVAPENFFLRKLARRIWV
jgi:hypothetical protein